MSESLGTLRNGGKPEGGIRWSTHQWRWYLMSEFDATARNGENPWVLRRYPPRQSVPVSIIHNATVSNVRMVAMAPCRRKSEGSTCSATATVSDIRLPLQASERRKIGGSAIRNQPLETALVSNIRIPPRADELLEGDFGKIPAKRKAFACEQCLSPCGF